MEKKLVRIVFAIFRHLIFQRAKVEQRNQFNRLLFFPLSELWTMARQYFLFFYFVDSRYDPRRD